MLLPIYTESASQEQHSKAITLICGIATLITTGRGTGNSRAMEVQHFDIFAWARNNRERTVFLSSATLITVLGGIVQLRFPVHGRCMGCMSGCCWGR